jgi:hypothetical protein
LQTGGGGQHEKIEHQPHEPRAQAPTGPALLGNLEAHSPAMSSASGSGLDRVPVPRSARGCSDRGASWPISTRPGYQGSYGRASRRLEANSRGPRVNFKWTSLVVAGLHTGATTPCLPQRLVAKEASIMPLLNSRRQLGPISRQHCPPRRSPLASVQERQTLGRRSSVTSAAPSPRT